MPVVAEGNFVLTVENDRLSLKAQEAFLKAVLADIGHKMDIEVVGEIPPQETVTVEFHNLPLEKALHSLSTNFGYQMKTDEGQQKITKIFVLQQGKRAVSMPELPASQTVVSSPTLLLLQEPERYPEAEVSQEKGGDPERPKSFQFEFDPTAFMAK
ncbi:MAG: hypothetical protein WBO24_11700 [Nitrospirales bacterium]